MPNKVTWKKGMRLTSGIFDAMDASNMAFLRLLAQAACARRAGLFPSEVPFELSVNVGNDFVEVVALKCTAITVKGQLVDISFDSRYSRTFDTRVPMPQVPEGEGLLLTVRMHDGEWHEIDATFSEAAYSFTLRSENSRLGDSELPVGRIVNRFGWRLDEEEFVPPCLYVSAHPRYGEQLERAIRISRALYLRCLSATECAARLLVTMVGGEACVATHRLDKERDTLTPEQLYSTLQQMIGKFVMGCAIEPLISLDNPEPFLLYTQKAYDVRSLYADIEEGLRLLNDLAVKMDGVCNLKEEEKPQPEPAPARPKPKPKPQPSQPKPEEVKAPTRKKWGGIEI